MRPFGARSPFQNNSQKREVKQPLVKPFNLRPPLEEHKFSVLASLPPPKGLTISPFPPLTNPTLSANKAESSKPAELKKPFSQESSTSPLGEPRFTSLQNKDSYKYTPPESYAKAVDPNLSPSSKEREKFDFITLQASPFLALDKDYENFKIGDLLKPLFTNKDYADSDNPLKTRKYYEFILVDTDSIEVEHQLRDPRDPSSISYSKFTIKKILSPFEWIADHLHTPINLSRDFKPQTFNWYDYQKAWYNFILFRPMNHTWFVKYGSNLANSTIPRWFYEWWSYYGGNTTILPKSFQDGYAPFQEEQKISTLPEHIKLCKYFIFKRISYIICWKFSIQTFDRIKYLSREILIKGWTPAPKESKLSPQTIGPSTPSKGDLKKRLKKALADLDNEGQDERAILQLLEEADSSQSEDNGDMLNPKGIAQAYLDAYYYK